eukprot:7948715-Alexandrium_andersonii.AAC.1
MRPHLPARWQLRLGKGGSGLTPAQICLRGAVCWQEPAAGEIGAGVGVRGSYLVPCPSKSGPA